MELCRLCACYDAIKMEIFGDEGRERNLVDKIQTCLPLQVSERDNLPKSLCYRCMYNLENFYDFRKRSVNAVALLESCIGQSEGSTEVGAELKEQFERLRSQLRDIKNDETQEKDIPMPHLEPQFPVPMLVPENRQTGGTGPGHSEALSSANVQSEAHPPSDDEVTEVKHEDDEVAEVKRDEHDDQHVSMDSEVVDNTSGRKKGAIKSGRYSGGVGEEELSEQEMFHTCSICNKAFSSNGHLTLHNKIHMKEAVMENHSKQPCCQTSSPVDKSLDLNWKSGYYRPYRCDLCNKSYSTAKHRWGHVSVCHRGNPLVTCPICSRVFSTCHNLAEHKRTKHGLEEGEIVDINDGEEAVTDNSSVSVTNSLKHSTSLTTQHSVDKRNSYSAIADNFQKSAGNLKSSQSGTSKSSLNNPEALHTGMKCLKRFKAEGELERHSLFHTRRVSSDTTSRSSNTDIDKKSEFTKSFKIGKKSETSKGSETLRKMDLKPIPGNKNETSLLKQTLLQDRECTEIRLTKRSPSLDTNTDDVKIKKRVGLSAETRSNSGSRRKNSKPRKIARNEEDGEDFDQTALNIYTCNNCSQVFHTPSDLQEHRDTHDVEEETNIGNGSNTKPYTCLLCEKHFSLRTSFSRHFNACHGIDPSEVMNISRYQRTPQKKQEICTFVPTGNSQSTSKKFDGQQKNGVSQMSGNQKTMEENVIVIDDTEDDRLPVERMCAAQTGFMCEVCTREFGDRASLWLHLRYTHKECAAYACGICLKICENNTQLYQHWKTFHPPDNSTDQRRYCCQMCGRQHDCRKKLLRHVSVHNLDNGTGGVYDPEMLVTPNTGFYKFENRDENSVSEHKPALEQEVLADFSSGEYASARITEGASSFGCELCYKSFPTEDGLVKHKKGAHKVNLNSEVDVLNSFRGSYQLYFVCELCGSSHRSKSERWRHVFRAHNGDSALTCNKEGCGKVFPTRTLKQEHCKNHHRLQGATPNVCEICGKLWGTRVDFWKHLMGVHSDCVPLTCGVCLKIFCTVPDLQGHVHSTHMPLTGGDFCCDICGRAYSNRSKLSRHRRIHLIDHHSDVLQVPLPKKPCSLPTSIPENSSSDIFFSASSTPSVGTAKKFVPAVKTVTKSISKSVSSQSSTISKLNKIPGLSQAIKASALKPQPLLFCDVCPEMTFHSIAQLAEHRRKIHSLHPCDLCSKFYGRTADLWKHVKRVHNNHPELTCQICKRISASKAHLESHISTKHYPKNPNPTTKLSLSSLCFTPGKIVKIPTLYPCHKCSKRFWKSHLLKKHQRHCLRAVKPKPPKLTKIRSDSSASTQDRTCDACSKVFSTPSRLKDHQKVAHAPQDCELCPDVSFTSKTDLFAHIKEYHNSHPNFCCPIASCSRTMRSKSDLNRHHKQHASVKYPPTCYLCGEVCVNKVRLWNHLTSAQHRAAIPLTCGVCFKYIPSTEELIQHVESFHPRALNAPDTCRICAKTYSSVYKVMTHFAKCHPEYYACKDCLQVFKSKRELQEHSERGHVRTLEDAEGVTSDVEGGEEAGKNEQVSRKVDGNETENYQLPCEFCREIFPTYAELIKHTEAKHFSSNSGAEEEPLNNPKNDVELNRVPKRPKRSYSCEKCSVSFRSPSDLVDHKNLKHASSISDIKPYHCVQCDRHFTNKSYYWKHINSPAHMSKQMRQKFVTAAVVSQRSLMTGKQQSYNLNFRDSTGDSSSVEAQSQVKFNSEVPFVYIPESILQGNVIKEVENEMNHTSGTTSSMKESSDKDKKNDHEGDLTLSSESVGYNSEHVLSYGEARDTSFNVKLNRRKSEVRTVYSANSGSNSPCYCQLCGKEWPALKHLWQHLIRNHRPEAAVTCGVCLEVCYDYHSLASHLSSQHPGNFTGEGNNFTCRICGRYHNARSKLIQHATIHIVLGTEPEHQPQSNLHNCQTCFRSFTSEQNLHDHQKTHQSFIGVSNSVVQSEKAEHKCEVCYKVCGNVGALVTHQKSHKVNEHELFTRSDDLVEMETEELEHDVANNQDCESEQFYSCDICLKVFKNESLFSEHKQTHVESFNNKNVTVSCGVKLQVPKFEKQHFYMCDICDLVFETEKSLAAHFESHSMSLQPTSSVSDAQHSYVRNLSQDFLGSVTYESQGMIPKGKFSCTVCHMIFPTPVVLSTHFEVSHNKRYTCSCCKNKTFTSYINLTKHFRICRLKKMRLRSCPASIQLLKTWKDKSKHNSVILSVDSQKPLSAKQSSEETLAVDIFEETQNGEPHSSVVGETEELKHDVTAQPLGEAAIVEFRILTESNNVEISKEYTAINAESLSISEIKSDLLVDSELKQNEFRDDGSETQGRSLSKAGPINSDSKVPNFQNNTNSLVEHFEELQQTEMDESHYSSGTESKPHINNPLGISAEMNDSELRNCRKDQFVCEDIDFRLEDEMTDYLMKGGTCLDIAMTVVSNSTPNPGEELMEVESPGHCCEAPVMEQQEQVTTETGQHSSVQSELCPEIIHKYVVQSSPNSSGVLQKSPTHMTENRDKSVGNGPTDSDMGHDIMAEVIDNEVISAEACDFSESNLNSTSCPLSTSDGSQQTHVSEDSLAICKDDLKKTKDCLYSLEDALDKLEAQNTE